jgi:hypothetical protein
MKSSGPNQDFTRDGHPFETRLLNTPFAKLRMVHRLK